MGLGEKPRHSERSDKMAGKQSSDVDFENAVRKTRAGRAFEAEATRQQNAVNCRNGTHKADANKPLGQVTLKASGGAREETFHKYTCMHCNGICQLNGHPVPTVLQ